MFKVALYGSLISAAPDLVQERRAHEIPGSAERLDGGQADVSGARAIRASGFEMIQERDDQRRVDLLQVQA